MVDFAARRRAPRRSARCRGPGRAGERRPRRAGPAAPAVGRGSPRRSTAACRPTAGEARRPGLHPACRPTAAAPRRADAQGVARPCRRSRPEVATGRRAGCWTTTRAFSGPLLDRIDITMQSRPVEVKTMTELNQRRLPSSHYRDRVEAARKRRGESFLRHPRRAHQRADDAEDSSPRTARSTPARRSCSSRPSTSSACRRARTTASGSCRAPGPTSRAAPTCREQDLTFAIGCRVINRRQDFVLVLDQPHVPGKGLMRHALSCG